MSADDILDLVADIGGPGLVALTFLLALAEGAVLADLVVPGEVGLVIAGAAAERTAGAPLAALIAVAAVGAIAGDSVGYLLGRRWGTAAVCRWGWIRRRVEPRLATARGRFAQRGGLTVAAARWVGALRAVVPVVAGTAGMPYRRFLAWDAPSALLWSTTVVTLGYTFGDDVAAIVDRFGSILTITVVVLIAVAVGVSRYRRREATEGDPNHSGRDDPEPDGARRPHALAGSGQDHARRRHR